MTKLETRHLFCSLCGASFRDSESVENIVWVNRARKEKITLVICEQCLMAIDDQFTMCPRCKNHVHRHIVEDCGKCPRCGFVEGEGLFEPEHWI